MLHSRSEVYQPSLADAPLAAAGLALSPVPGQRAFSARHKRATAAPDDAELLALGEAFEAAWAAEYALFAHSRSVPDDIYGAAAGRTRAIVDEIASVPATTLSGLTIKARALAWCYPDVPFEEEELFEGDSADVQILRSTMRDLLTIDGRPFPTAPAAPKAA